MEVEKANSKSNGFFKIFDWGSKTKKPKKRLFANSPTSEKTANVKDTESVSRLNLEEEDQMTVISSIKCNTTTSCSSSVTEEELTTKKPPGVVARLMGLDSLPTPDPLLSPPFHPKLDASSSDLSARKMVILRPHNKMPSSPIERFQTETIPNNKRGKMIPITYYKLLSPIKNNNNFISGRNADQIMEVASRIIDTDLSSNLNMSPFRVYDSGRFVRGNPNSKPVNRRLNVAQNGGDLNGEKGKRRVNAENQTRVSLPQNRVSLPKRESANPKRSSNSNEKKPVLVQNNRKQNSLGTRNGTQRVINGERNNMNNMNNNASFGKNRVSNQLKGNPNSNSSRINSRVKRLSTISEANHASTSSSNNNNNNHNNITNNSNINNNNNNNSHSNDILVKRSMRHINHNIVVERNISSTKKSGTNTSNNNSNNNNNIVSFTFTSTVDKFHKNAKKDSHLSTGENNNNIIDGDFLGVLLEQKLRELMSGSGSPYRKSAENERNELEISSCLTDELALTGENDESVSSVNIDTQENEKERIINEKKSEEINDLSPFSTLDGSCNSSESYESSKGGKLCTSIQARKSLDSFRFNEGLEIEDEEEEETEFSESSSSVTIITEMPFYQNNNYKSTPELDFVKEVLNSVTFSDGKIIIESNKGVFESIENEEKDGKISKKMLFGCVYEFLEIKCAYYFGAGYNLWVKGDLFVNKISPEGIFKEVWVEKGIEEESMVDFLVDRDMSVDLGKWVDFEIEAFESGSEIEGEILGFLIDELVGEFGARF